MVHAASSSRWLTGKLWYVVCQELGSTFHSKISTPNSLTSARGQMSSLYFAQLLFSQLVVAYLNQTIWPDCMYGKTAYPENKTLFFPRHQHHCWHSDSLLENHCLYTQETIDTLGAQVTSDTCSPLCWLSSASSNRLTIYICLLSYDWPSGKKRVELNLTPLIRKQRGVFTKTGSGRRWVTDGGQIFPCQVTKQSTKCPDGKVTATTCLAFVWRCRGQTGLLSLGWYVCCKMESCLF